MATITTENAAIVLDAGYVSACKRLTQAGGTLSRAAAAAAVKAANLAVESGRLFEIADLIERRKSAPSITARHAISKALDAVFALALGIEGADKRGNTVFGLHRADCKAEYLVKADKTQWRSRAALLRDLDTVRVRFLADQRDPDLETLQEKAVAAYMRYLAAGGTAAAFAEAVKSAQADAAAKSAK